MNNLQTHRFQWQRFLKELLQILQFKEKMAIEQCEYLVQQRVQNSIIIPKYARVKNKACRTLWNSNNIFISKLAMSLSFYNKNINLSLQILYTNIT